VVQGVPVQVVDLALVVVQGGPVQVAAPAVVPVVAVPVETQVVQVPAAVAGHLAVAVVVDRVAAPVVVQTILPVRPMTNHQDKGNHLASHNKQMSLPKTHRKTRR
jgi:hypothetical protein